MKTYYLIDQEDVNKYFQKVLNDHVLLTLIDDTEIDIAIKTEGDNKVYLILNGKFGKWTIEFIKQENKLVDEGIVLNKASLGYIPSYEGLLEIKNNFEEDIEILDRILSVMNNNKIEM